MWLALAVWVLDVALFSTAGSDLAQVGSGNLSPIWLIGYAAAGSAALVWRKRAPLVVFGIVCLHAMIGTTLVTGYQPVLCVLVAVYTVGAHCPPERALKQRAGIAALWPAAVPDHLSDEVRVRQMIRSQTPARQCDPRQRAWVIAPAVLPSIVVAVNEAWRYPQDRRVPVFIGLLAVFVLLAAGVWALGYWTGLSRRRLAESQRLRKVEAELAVAQERTRISRELHDIVAHTVTVMVLQAAGAQRILRTDPERAEQSLGQVAELGRTAMNELRRMLSLTQPAPVSDAETAVSLDDLDQLLDRVRGSGVTVGFTQEGTPRRIDASVALAAYRTVQEALTNTAKHAGPEASAQVRLVWTDDLLVEVVDGGTARPPVTSKELSTGRGLLGLRERVSIAGGRFDAARDDGGGFRVAAVLPLAEV